MQLYFHKVLNENGRINDYRNVEIHFNDSNQLIVKCCDINNTADSMFGDSGVDFYLNIDEINVIKLKTIIESNKKDNLSLNSKNILDFFYSKYANQENCFENIMDFLKENNIDYDYNRW